MSITMPTVSRVNRISKVEVCLNDKSHVTHSLKPCYEKISFALTFKVFINVSTILR